MLGAMPAVAVRLERRKAEKRLKRPSQLYLSGYNLRQTTSPNRASPTPSPLLSPPRDLDEPFLPEIYVCSKISALHLAVVSLLLGAVILIVGLVQLKPGADAPGHRYYLIAIGCSLIAMGLIITVARCILLHWRLERGRHGRKTARHSQSQPGDAGLAMKNGEHLDLKDEPMSIDLKHLYNSSDVMFMDDSDTGRATSPGESLATIGVPEGRPIGPHPDTCSLAMVSPTEFDTLLVGVHKGGGT